MSDIRYFSEFTILIVSFYMLLAPLSPTSIPAPGPLVLWPNYPLFYTNIISLAYTVKPSYKVFQRIENFFLWDPNYTYFYLFPLSTDSKKNN